MLPRRRPRQERGCGDEEGILQLIGPFGIWSVRLGDGDEDKQTTRTDRMPARGSRLIGARTVRHGTAPRTQHLEVREERQMRGFRGRLKTLDAGQAATVAPMAQYSQDQEQTQVLEMGGGRMGSAHPGPWPPRGQGICGNKGFVGRDGTTGRRMDLDLDLDSDLNQARRGRKQGTPDDGDDGDYGDDGGRFVRGVRMYLCERAMATRRRMATAPHLPAASVFATCPVGGCAAQHRGERARPISFHSSGPLPPLIGPTARVDTLGRRPRRSRPPLARQWKLPNLSKLHTPLFAVSTSSGARKGASNGGDGGPSLPVPLVPMCPRAALCAAGRVVVGGAKEAPLLGCTEAGRQVRQASHTHAEAVSGESFRCWAGAQVLSSQHTGPGSSWWWALRLFVSLGSGTGRHPCPPLVGLAPARAPPDQGEPRWTHEGRASPAAIITAFPVRASAVFLPFPPSLPLHEPSMPTS
ncbi:hypothetical protein PCL_02823 [Purpureocillium lilacinum]|uniref:Uncharacterized protein n=1 Tax=Purpureocillium lilacinum TaxID=33203 RepID=A0A2U3DYY4_PURLI|nr:hypothetical protein PCL_02823 [Purpureocillium lilacinum]